MPPPSGRSDRGGRWFESIAAWRRPNCVRKARPSTLPITSEPHPWGAVGDGEVAWIGQSAHPVAAPLRIQSAPRGRDQ